MGRVTPPEEFAAALKAALPGAKVRIDTPAGAGASLMNMRNVADLTLSREVLGFTPRFDIAAAVRDMVDWHRANRRT
jgi:nucleoside-diphosphate-sugar epimerase